MPKLISLGLAGVTALAMATSLHAAPVNKPSLNLHAGTFEVRVSSPVSIDLPCNDVTLERDSVRLGFLTNDQGKVSKVWVIRSSGSEEFDERAIERIRNGIRKLNYIPSRNKKFSIDVVGKQSKKCEPVELKVLPLPLR